MNWRTEHSDQKPSRWRAAVSGAMFRRARGFTLVELLVVVSIIALLISILLPSLRKARSQVKRVACQANLRQIAIAWDEYLVSHEGRFLQGTNVNVNFGGQQGLGGSQYGGTNPNEPPVVRAPKPKVLNPYLKLPEVAWAGAEVFHCPADKGSNAYGPTCGGPGLADSGLGSTYATFEAGAFSASYCSGVM